MVRRALSSGAGLATLRAMVERQGGDPTVIDDPSRLPKARAITLVRSSQTGFITRMDAGLVGRASMYLGAGRHRSDDVIDPAVGVRLLKKPGDEVTVGDAVMELHHNQDAEVPDAVALAQQSLVVGATPPPAGPLILGWVHANGESTDVTAS